jgi:hypothetical protein
LAIITAMSDKPAQTPKSQAEMDLMEMHFRAGMRTLEDIGKEFNLSKGRISQIAKKYGWERDLAPKIRQRTEARVARDTAQEELRKQALNDPTKQSARRLAEAEVVDLNVEVKAGVIRGQKKAISRANGLFFTMLGELESVSNSEGQSLVEMLIIATTPPAEGEDEEAERRRKAKQKKLLDSIVDLPGRIDSGKRLVETLEKLVRMEREAYGISVEPETPESPMVSLLQRVKNTALGVVHSPEEA